MGGELKLIAQGWLSLLRGYEIWIFLGEEGNFAAKGRSKEETEWHIFVRGHIMINYVPKKGNVGDEANWMLPLALQEYTRVYKEMTWSYWMSSLLQNWWC